MSLIKEKGFTLVEIVFVLAISSLVIIIVFLAVPQARTTGRDSQRKAYLEQVASNVEKFKESAANGYNYPPDAATFQANFTPPGGAYAVTNNDTDPMNGQVYGFAGDQTPSSSQPAGITYLPQQNCAGGAGTGLYALKITLESGTDYCLDNH